MARTKAEIIETNEVELTHDAIMEAARIEAARIVAEAKAEAEEIKAEAVAEAPKTQAEADKEHLAAIARSNELVEFYVPRTEFEKDDIYICVNGENVLIKRGERVTIRRRFKEAYENAEIQKAKALAYIEGKEDEANGAAAYL